MKPLLLTLLLTGLNQTGPNDPPASAQDVPPPAILRTQVVALDPTMGQFPLLPCIERFYSPTLEIQTILLATPDSPPELAFDIYASSDHLFAPILSNQPASIQPAPQRPGLYQATLRFSLPPPATPHTFYLRLRSRQAKDSPWQSVTALPLILLPVDHLKLALQKLHSPQLQVFGPALGLRQLLDEWSIPYQDLGSTIPFQLPPDSLVIGELKSTANPVEPGKNSLLFATCHQMSFDRLKTIIHQKQPDHHSLILTLNQPADWRHSPILHRQLADLLAHRSSPP